MPHSWLLRRIRSEIYRQKLRYLVYLTLFHRRSGCRLVRATSQSFCTTNLHTERLVDSTFSRTIVLFTTTLRQNRRPPADQIICVHKMGCCGPREKLPKVKEDQKWEYINLDEFHHTSCWTPLSYGVLYISILISIAVYVVDTYTAVNLLAFDRWSGQIKPYIPLKYSRWIFAGCIILSFVFLFFRWLRAIRVMKRGGVADSYLDPLAVCVQSVRMGQEGRGWKRFLVFAELSKGKKGADYVALFTHYSFEAWLRILFAEGPRQVINALTLYSVMQLNLIPAGENAAKDGQSPVVQFFVNVGLLADKSGREQAVILFGMLFTLVIWVITMINLMVAVVLYLLFLFHHIPSSDGGLTGYCRRKINKSMEKIVRTKVDKALRKENALLARQQAMDGHDAIKRQPTLPNLDLANGEKPPLLSRQTTLATLPEYTSSRPSTAAGSALTSPSDLERQPTLPDIDAADFYPGPPTRTATQASSASWASHGSSAPLIGGAAGMGHAPPGPVQNSGIMSPTGSLSSRPATNRSYSGYSHSAQRSYTPGIGQRPAVGQTSRSRPGLYQMETVSRPGTAMSVRQPGGATPSPVDPYSRWTPAEEENPYFPPSSDYSGQGAAATLPRSSTPGGASTRSYTPRVSSSMRSITPAMPSYSSPYNAGHPPLPRLHTNSSSISANYRPNFDSPAQSSFTPQTPYRSYTQPTMSPSADQYTAQTFRPSPTGYGSQAPPGHLPPIQRPGTAPPSNRQTTPTADHVMEDIMKGY